MYKAQIISDWNLGFDLFVDKPVRVWTDIIPDRVCSNALDLLFILEPRAICDVGDRVVRAVEDGCVDWVFTYDEYILASIGNSSFFPHGDCWVESGSDFSEKEIAVSAILGGKELTDGHIMRRDLCKMFESDQNFHIYTSSRFPLNWDIRSKGVLGESKEPAFRTRYHLVIENSRQKNCFTEKIIDCMVAGSVPVYWGCPNISDWFDPAGMIILSEGLEPCFEEVNSLLRAIEMGGEKDFDSAVLLNNQRRAKVLGALDARIHQEVIRFLKSGGGR